MAGKKGGQKKDHEARLSDLKLQFLTAKSFRGGEGYQRLVDIMSSQLSRLAKAMKGLEYQSEQGTEALDLLEEIASDITKISEQEGSKGPATGKGSKELKFKLKSEEGSKDVKQKPSGSKSQDGSEDVKKLEDKLTNRVDPLVAETRLSAIKKRLETTGHIRGRAVYRMLVRPLLDHLERLSRAMVGGDQSVQGNDILDLFERLYEKILEIPSPGSEFECCDRIYLDIEDLGGRIGRFVDDGFLNGRPHNIAGNGIGQTLGHHLDSESSGNGNDYRARVLTMRQKLNTASRSGLIISRTLVHQLSLQLQRMPETVVASEDHSAQRNEALDLLEKLCEMATQIPPGDEEYAVDETFHLELPRLVKCIDRTVDDGGLLHETISETVSETVSVLEPEKIIGNENVPDVHSEVEASRKSEVKVQKKDSGAEDKGKQIREPLNRLKRVEKQVTDLQEMVKAQKESADQEKEKIQHLQVESSATAEYARTIVKDGRKKFKSKAEAEEIEGLKQQLANLKSEVKDVRGVLLSSIQHAVKNRKFKGKKKLKKLLVVKVLKKHISKGDKRLKKLASDEDLRIVKSDFEEKLENLESAGVRELNNLLSAQKYYIWWVIGSLVVLSLRDIEITPSGLLKSPLRLVLLGAVVLLAKLMNWWRCIV